VSLERRAELVSGAGHTDQSPRRHTGQATRGHRGVRVVRRDRAGHERRGEGSTCPSSTTPAGTHRPPGHVRGELLPVAVEGRRGGGEVVNGVVLLVDDHGGGGVGGVKVVGPPRQRGTDARHVMERDHPAAQAAVRDRT